MKNTKRKNKLDLIELMESLGAKPQAHGDYIVWELDSRDFKKEQATSNKHYCRNCDNLTKQQVEEINKKSRDEVTSSATCEDCK